MKNLTYIKFVEYVDEVGIERAEKDISSLTLASRLSAFFLVVFLLLLHSIAVITARNLDFSLRFSLISGLAPVVGPVYLIVKLAFMQSFSTIILTLALIPCIVMFLYNANVRRKRACLHNAVCMVAEKLLIPDDTIEPNVFQIINSHQENDDGDKGDARDQIVSGDKKLAFNNVIIDDAVIDEPAQVAKVTKVSENQSSFITTDEAKKNSNKNEVDRLIDEILSGKK